MCCDDEVKSNKAHEQWNKADSHLAKNSECRENIDGLFKPTRHCENKPNEWMKVWRIQGRRLTTSSEVKSMKPGKIRKSLQMRETIILLQEQQTLTFKSLLSVQFFLNVPFLKHILFLWRKSWIFSIITPLFSVPWSFRNHSNMLIYCSTSLIIINCNIVVVQSTMKSSSKYYALILSTT